MTSTIHPIENFNLDTWIVSDTHFRHKNIIKYCNRPMSHDAIMEKNWHALVKPEDTVLHLGDLCVWYGDTEAEAWEIAERLPGKKFMLRGNHDRLTDDDFAELGFTVIPEFVQKFGQTKVLFSHYPDTSRAHLWNLNVHGHIHNSRKETWSKKHLNVSIEVMNYQPVRLREVLK